VPTDELTELLRYAHAKGIRAAVHAIGDRANTLALDAFEASGARGSVEHAQLLHDDDVERMARLGLVASVQPVHLLDDRDVADHHWAGRTGRAFAFAALARAGVRMAFGSDAPVAPLDPWAAISAAVHRTQSGQEAAGEPADLVVLGDELSRTGTAVELHGLTVALCVAHGRVASGALR